MFSLVYLQTVLFLPDYPLLLKQSSSYVYALLSMIMLWHYIVYSDRLAVYTSRKERIKCFILFSINFLIVYLIIYIHLTFMV